VEASVRAPDAAKGEQGSQYWVGGRGGEESGVVPIQVLMVRK
jgi:hypothetical protein